MAVYSHANAAGWTLYWITYGVMAFAAVVFFAMALRRPINNRKHHYASFMIVATASLAYYAMASQGGATQVNVYQKAGLSRQIFWARYVDWFFTTPLLLLDLIFLAEVSKWTMASTIVADILMILTGLFGAVEARSNKWGWFAMGCVFMFWVFYELAVNIRKSAVARGFGTLYTGLLIWLLILWIQYPIVWGLAEGSSTISSDTEIAWYAALDICAKVIFGFWLLLGYEMAEKRGTIRNTAGTNKNAPAGTTRTTEMTPTPGPAAHPSITATHDIV